MWHHRLTNGLANPNRHLRNFNLNHILLDNRKKSARFRQLPVSLLFQDEHHNIYTVSRFAKKKPTSCCTNVHYDGVSYIEKNHYYVKFERSASETKSGESRTLIFVSEFIVDCDKALCISFKMVCDSFKFGL